jgi:hypothetical protein
MNRNFCGTCGKVIEEVYATLGGNIEPYIPAKEYHLGCVPPLRRLHIDIEDRLNSIFDLLPKTVGAGWQRLPDENDFEVFLIRVPKRD